MQGAAATGGAPFLHHLLQYAAENRSLSYGASVGADRIGGEPSRSSAAVWSTPMNGGGDGGLDCGLPVPELDETRRGGLGGEGAGSLVPAVVTRRRRVPASLDFTLSCDNILNILFLSGQLALVSAHDEFVFIQCVHM